MNNEKTKYDTPISPNGTIGGIFSYLLQIFNERNKTFQTNMALCLLFHSCRAPSCIRSRYYNDSSVCFILYFHVQIYASTDI